MKKKISCLVIILSIVAMFFCACSNQVVDDYENVIQQSTTSKVEIKEVEKIGGQQEQQEKQEQRQVETSDAKYIFYIIGDGMGETHLKLGDMFLKLVHGDMDESGAWNDFDVKIDVEAGIDSSRGGTMLSTGVQAPSGRIANFEDEDLTTIMDIAKQNNLATGVVSMASFTDATPAAFLSHTDKRSKSQAITRGIHESNVDIIVGGGIEYTYEAGSRDYIIDAASEKVPLLMKNYDLLEVMQDNGYKTFVGNDAVLEIENNNTYDKAFFSFTRGNMLFNFMRKTTKNREKQKSIPDLDELTDLAIRSLEQDEDGFVLMVEESAIDDACHQKNISYIASEMGMMDKTLDVIIEFYKKHPDNTTIILTADHETGNMIFDENRYKEFTDIEEGIPWDKTSTEINDFFKENYDHGIDIDIINTTKEYIDSDFYGREFENNMLASGVITNRICKDYGIDIRSNLHSYQTVPLFVYGKYADDFSNVKIISDIPQIICDVWDLQGDLGLEGDET